MNRCAVSAGVHLWRIKRHCETLACTVSRVALTTRVMTHGHPSVKWFDLSVGRKYVNILNFSMQDYVLNIPHLNWRYCSVLGPDPDQSLRKYHHPVVGRRLVFARNVLAICVCVENKDEGVIENEVGKEELTGNVCTDCCAF